MILLRICSQSRPKIEEITNFLLSEKLIIEADLTYDMERRELQNGNIQISKVHLLSAKTKALLFPLIDKVLKEKYPQNLPEIYSVAIVHMDWDQTLKLKKNIQEV